MTSTAPNTFENETETTPWYYDMSLEDTNWIITSSFMIFTMQTGNILFSFK